MLDIKILKHEKIRWREAKWIQPDDFKEIKPESLEKLKKSIKNNGFIQPFNVWENDGKINILDGHHRKMALEQLECEGVDIPDLLNANFIECSSYKEAVKYVFLYSSTYATATKESSKAFLDLADIKIEEIGYEVDIVNVDLSPINVDIKNNENDIELKDGDWSEKKQEVVVLSKNGDYVEIEFNGSKGILVCGDCNVGSTIATIKELTNKKASLCFTDPPYNVGYKGNDFGKEWEKIENDKMSSEDFEQFLNSSFATMEYLMDFGASIYCCYSYIWGKEFRKAFENVFKYSQDIVWDKTRISFDRYNYHHQTEPIMFGWKKGSAHKFYGETNLNNIWVSKRPTKSGIHPTEKPLDLIQNAIVNSSQKDELVIDLFSGSGSTMITSLQLGRDFAGTEIDCKRFAQSVVRTITALEGCTVKLNGEPATRDSFLAPIGE